MPILPHTEEALSFPCDSTLSKSLFQNSGCLLVMIDFGVQPSQRTVSSRRARTCLFFLFGPPAPRAGRAALCANRQGGRVGTQDTRGPGAQPRGAATEKGSDQRKGHPQAGGGKGGLGEKTPVSGGHPPAETLALVSNPLLPEFSRTIAEVGTAQMQGGLLFPQNTGETVTELHSERLAGNLKQSSASPGGPPAPLGSASTPFLGCPHVDPDVTRLHRPPPTRPQRRPPPYEATKPLCKPPFCKRCLFRILPRGGALSSALSLHRPPPSPAPRTRGREPPCACPSVAPALPAPIARCVPTLPAARRRPLQAEEAVCGPWALCSIRAPAGRLPPAEARARKGQGQRHAHPREHRQEQECVFRAVHRRRRTEDFRVLSSSFLEIFGSVTGRL